MSFLTRVIVALLFMQTLSPAVRAATLTNAELPSAIQSCIAASTCFASSTSAYDSGMVSAFQLVQDTGSGFEDSWLMRYTLVPPSGQSSLNSALDNSFTGSLWLLAKMSYSTSESAHPFTLYLDKVSPTPFNMFGQSGDGVLESFMPTADLLAGSSYLTVGIDFFSNSYSFGNLTGETPLPCLAEGCESHARLNLVGLNYEDVGSSIILTDFNPLDTRGLVFTQYQTYPCYGDTSCAMDDSQAFYVSAVPVPGAMWLFGSGLAGLVGLLRRRRP